MAGQMCWLPQLGKDGEKILHLRIMPHEAWRPYTAFGQYAVPDYDIPGGSRGFATYQRLFRQGWQLIPSNQAYNLVLPSPIAKH